MVPTTRTDDETALPAEPATDTYRPLCDPEPYLAGNPGQCSVGSMEIVSGDTALSSWGGHNTASVLTEGRVLLQLAPDCPIVIGRSEGTAPEYLDPTYVPTRIVPGTGQAVVRSGSEGKDTSVSRAHFMLRGNALGIVVTNGVPRLGGGIRPPTNSTWIVSPCWRRMEDGEDYQVEHGEWIDLYLPNATVVRIGAE